MAAATYELSFDGYWREPNKGGVTNRSGIYCVYSCVPNTNVTPSTVAIKKLIYIGESQNVRDRLSGHEKKSDWEKHLKYGEQLCYSAAEVDTSYRIRCEAAMINQHKPPVNTEYVDSFPFDTTTMHLRGETSLLNSSFTVWRR